MGHAMGSTSNLAFVLPESLPRLVTTRQSTRPHHGTVPGSASRSTASASTAAWLCAATATVAMAHRRGLKARAVQDGTVDTAPKVVLMGDSVLDNFFWLETPKRHLRVQLQDALAKSRNAKVKQLKCVNLAVDQMTTFDFVERRPQDNPWDVYAKARRMVAFEDDEDKEYVVDGDGVIRSVENLKQLKNVKWVVLSLGCNDVYLNAEVKGKLVSSLLPQSEGKRKEVAQEFAKRLKGVLEKVKAGAPDASLILVVPYQPHQDFSLMMGAPINDEGKRIYGDILGDGTRVLERQVQPSQRQEQQADNVVRRWTEQQMELLLPLAWSRWKGFWLERQRRVECAGLKEKVEVYSKEVDASLELRWALAEEKAARRAAEKQQQQLQSEMKELLQNDLKLNTQLEQQEHSFRLEIQQLRTEVERRPFSARSRSKSTPREDLVASPQSDAVLAEDARATAATVVHDFLHFESASPVCHGYRWPGGGLSPSRPSKETSPVRKAIPVEELRKQRGRDLFQQERHGGRLKPPLPRPRIEPAAVCDKASVPEAHHNHLFRGRSPSDSAVDSRGSDANGVFANEAQWAMNRMNLHQQGHGLPLEDSIASDALTVRDDGSEGSCPGDATAVFLQSELQDALESALAQHSPSVGSAPCFSAEA